MIKIMWIFKYLYQKNCLQTALGEEPFLRLYHQARDGEQEQAKPEYTRIIK